MTELSYLTREFVRKDCGTNGATFSDEDCDRIIQEVKRLHSEGKFFHTGCYWIANRLAAEGIIKPEFETGAYGYISAEDITREYGE